VEEQE
jgi:hypothetical protein